MARTSDNVTLCSFCGRPPSASRQIVQGQTALICEDCIRFCNNFINGEGVESKITDPLNSFVNPPTPQEIKNHLDNYVIGQEYSKKILSVAAYNHYKRVFHNKLVEEEFKKNKKRSTTSTFTDSDESILLEKSNILLIGATGVGKTLLARTLANFLNVPFAIADATSITEAGYVGEDVEHMLLKLYQAADNNLEATQHGIIFIDEVDKISRKSKNPSITRDVSGEGVQQALLKIIEGTTASVPPTGGRKHPHQNMLQIDTTNILFICGGAFVGLEDIVKARTIDTTLGFGSSDIKESSSKKEIVKSENIPVLEQDQILRQLHPQDLIDYGFVPEFIGRLPVITSLESHTVDTLKRVLIEPKNSIVRQMQQFFKLIGADLYFEEDALERIATLAFEQKVGARGLKTIVEELLLDSMYKIPSETNIKQVRITKENVDNRSASIIEFDEDEKTA